jgi:uncharacterized SAM-binding protein YcdF (DUF218 family)
MYAKAASVLAFILWPISVLVIVALWMTALLDIARHRRREASRNTGPLGMAALVSAVAVVAVAGSSVLLAGQWVEAVSWTGAEALYASEPEGEAQPRSYIFSFGLENASYGSLADPANARESRRVPR